MKKICALSAALVLSGSLVGAAAPAGAVTTTDTCTDLTTQALQVERTSNLPATMLLGQTQDVSLTSVTTVPSTLVTTLFGALSGLTGTGTSQGTLEGPAGTSLPIGANPTSLVGIPLANNDLSLPVTSETLPFTPSQVGDYQVLAGPATATLLTTLTCVPAGGTVVDSVRVLAPTTTAVRLSPATAAFGQVDRATATVDTNTGGLVPADGAVKFSVGRWSKSAAVRNGEASVSLPRLAAGRSYRVNASFQPSASSFAAGSAASRSLSVVKDTTRTRVAAPNIRRHHREVARVRVVSAHGVVPQGKVRAVLKKGTHTLRARTVRLRDGVARVDFGRIAKRGKGYVVKARYLGNGNFRTSAGRDGFRVR